jgi:hypothetical protein
METKDFAEINSLLKKEIEKYTPPFVCKKSSEKGIELYTAKPYKMGERIYPEIMFAASQVMKGHVGFYFFPLYMCPEMKEKIPAELLKTLKGKTCFNIKKLDDKLLKQVKDTLKKGYEFYKTKGIA